MKKVSFLIVLVLILSLLLCPLASADVITALATEINPEHLEKTASYARILGYNEETNSLTVELIVPETFARDDVLALQPGDGISTDGKELTVATIQFGKDFQYAIINDWEDEYVGETVDLVANIDENFTPMAYDDYTWSSVAVLDCPVTESLVLLDYFDASREIRTLPLVYTADEIIDMIAHDDHKDFAANNVYVVFDGEGNLAVIIRYYVPWG